MFISNFYSKCCFITLVLLMTGIANAAIISMDIDALCTESDYNLSNVGNELKINYQISNTTQSTSISDALYRILLPVGINQSIYAIEVPESWVALVRANDIELYTLNSYKAIQPGQEKSFAIYAYSTKTEEAEIQAMTTLGDWSIPAYADVPVVPEPATILLLAGGAILLNKKRN